MLAALPFAAIAVAAFVGLGFHREAAPWAISGSATLLVLGPPLAAGGLAPYHRRLWLTGMGLIGWSVGLLMMIPVYFPGERRDAVATGVALFGLGMKIDPFAQAIANLLPPEGDLAKPGIAEARPIGGAPAQPAPTALGDRDIALPFEGEGRRMSIPVVFEQGTATFEADMTFDTGATYSTLPTAALEKLGARPLPESPVMKLHTANGEREAPLVLVDRVWLGDLELEGVAVAVCDQCESGDTQGLLGLNVSGAFNMNIDADRREVVFSARDVYDRHLDIQPFLDLDAWTRQLPGGRIEVGVTAKNRADRAIDSAVIAVSCRGSSWAVDLPALDARGDGQIRERLPLHDACEKYEISLDHAHW
jgi:hypothetical protein